ncbi:MAG TPA: SET domain-containing protein-lysine N-methyltransferase [Chitinophagaceae bacterium]
MLRQTTPSQYSVIGSHGFAEVREDAVSLSKSLHSIVTFTAGETLCSFGAAAILKTPTYLTVQTGMDEHIHLKPEFLKFINHSCDPNVFFDISAMELVALKDIRPGDEFTFFYPSTEWQMAQPFDCVCGSPRCLGKISGAAGMNEAVLKQHRLNEFILQQLAI